MTRDVLLACAPWCAMLVATLLALRAVVRLGGRGDGLLWQRLWRLHADQAGAVQSLSFVLTVPIFVMLMLFIVQVSQLMVAQVVVQYAAFAAVRSAVVWIPAETGGTEQANCIGINRVVVAQNPQGVSGTIYRIPPNGAKYQRIRSAAVMACAPLGPSRRLSAAVADDPRADLLYRAALTFAPGEPPGTTFRRRLGNKIAYSEAATQVDLTFFHPSDEPELRHYYTGYDGSGRLVWTDFEVNELGWQDQVTATVTHEFALLPGPGRFLATTTNSPTVTDQVAPRVLRRGSVFTFPITASATLGIEGEKSVRPFYQTF